MTIYFKKTIGTISALLLLGTGIPSILYRFIEAPSAADKLDLLGYFTIQSNIIVLVIVLITLFGKQVDRRFKIAAGAAITITALVFQVLLRPSIDMSGYSGLVSNINHGATTILYLLWFWLSGETSEVIIKDTLYVIPYPALYCLFGIFEAFFREKPIRYFFLDIRSIGWSQFSLWFTALTMLFLSTGYIIIKISHMFSGAEGQAKIS